MATKRYAVLDSDNIVVNIILVDDPLPKKYWPGYGAKMICLSGSATNPDDCGIPVLSITPTAPQIGDTINVGNAAVTKFVPTSLTQKDYAGNNITTSSAPKVRLKKDVEPSK